MAQYLLFEQPGPLLLKLMPLVPMLSLANGGFSEFKGKHMQYSKFWNIGNFNFNNQKQQISVSSKTGMFSLYVPSCIAGLASFFIFPYHDGGLRFFLLKFVLASHFLKRVLEVLFVHKFTGSMNLDSTITISASYLLSTSSMIYIQNISQALQEPIYDLKSLGIVLFFIGITGNFYHHYLLANLRGRGEKEYKIPKGGLFDLVTCPHYLFEIIEFFGFFCISQTMYSLGFTLGTTAYLMGRSYATQKWYLSKFEAFPKDVKALVPYIF